MNSVRILTDQLRGRTPREHYWALADAARAARALLAPGNREFRRVALADLRRYLLRGNAPVAGQARERARAAAGWILRAQDATPDDGVSFGYFPCETEGGWHLSYPETTGYIIPSLLDFARREQSDEARARALRMAHWEVEVQMPSGAVQGGRLCEPARQTPAAFNTGMVLHGWSAALAEQDEPALQAAAHEAARFLVDDLDAAGHFRTIGEFVSSAPIKVYHSLCGWGLHLFGDLTGEARYRRAAVAAVAAALAQQQANGWIANNCLTRPSAPLTHTIGYTLQAMLEVGVLAGREDFVAGARRAIDALLPRIDRRGVLPGRFYPDWTAAVFSSCLTGSAQLAIVMYRLYQLHGEAGYREAADRVVDQLKAVQVLDSADPGINGALAGSCPIFGEYMTRGYPNWATKYFLDALLLQERCAAATADR